MKSCTLNKFFTYILIFIPSFVFVIYSEDSFVCINENNLNSDTSYLNRALEFAGTFKTDGLFYTIFSVLDRRSDSRFKLSYLTITSDTNQNYFMLEKIIELMENAIKSNDLNRIKLLYKYGYPIHTINDRKLFKTGYDLLSYTISSPLEYINDDNDSTLLDSILELGENVDGLYPMFESPLYIAIRNNQYRYASMLISRGAKTDVVDCCYGTTLSDLLNRNENNIQETRTAIKRIRSKIIKK